MFDKRLKRLNIWDISLIKLGVAAFVLFLITVWPALMDLVHKVHWGWFLGVAIVAMLKPCMRFWK